VFHPAAAASDLLRLVVFYADRGDDRRVGGGGLVRGRGVDRSGEAAEAGPGYMELRAEDGRGDVVVEEGGGGRGGRHFFGFCENGAVATSAVAGFTGSEGGEDTVPSMAHMSVRYALSLSLELFV
jgi:hypothetical protein